MYLFGVRLFKGNFGRLETFSCPTVLVETEGHGGIMLSLEFSKGLFFFIPKFSGDHCLPIIDKSWESNVKNSLPKIVENSEYVLLMITDDRAVLY